ncbi:helix-turn-helix domain-containing protein [Nitrosospira sp. NRS527]|uniref:helix-turn-helix domain-containing protein n=1 Tax=Nitrosospira sp. NRS527 TaxID=155925 RepID=UPI001AFA709B|nr:helix-turn-helix domain-containing protein [Nitrosospira sp. NRS527]BCT69316.1 hypothetical protein NNRS527_02936 [Nitrosospira sp. NRS527]
MPYVQLTSEERYVIYHLKLFKLSLREIARRLGRHHTTISREIQRNGPLSQAGHIGMKALSNKRCNVEGSHVIIDAALIPRWCTMLSKVCEQKDHRMSLPPG